jgi:hypothetical protein
MNWLQSRVLWAVAALGVLVMTAGFGYVKGHAAGKAAGDAAIAKLTSQYEAASAKAASDALAKQTALQTKYAAADARHAQELKDAKAKSDAVIADLRNGTLRLRREWAGCEAAASVPGATAGAGELDATAQRRAESAAAIVRIGADADAQIRALQAVVKADRQ